MNTRAILILTAVLTIALTVFYATRNKVTPIAVRVERCERATDDVMLAAPRGEVGAKVAMDTAAWRELEKKFGPGVDCEAFGDSLRKRYKHWWQRPSRWSK